MIFSYIVVAIFLSAIATIASALDTVTIGKDGNLAFDPPSISNYTGDGVHFIIYHADPPFFIAESTFDQPCTAKPDGTQFGVLPSSTDPYDDQILGLSVDPGTPRWFFDTNRCAAGVVFAVNPTTDQTYDAFKAKAMSSGTTSSTTAPLASASSNKSTSTSVRTALASIQTITVAFAAVIFLIQ